MNLGPRLLGAFVRVGLAIALVFVSATLLTELAPGSPGARAARAAGVLPADDSRVPQELRTDVAERLAVAFDLQGSLVERLTRGLVGLAHGDLGRSWRSGQPITQALSGPAFRTAILVAMALFAALFLGIGLAAAKVIAQSGTRSVLRRLVGVGIAAGFSILLVVPPVWLALVGMRLDVGGDFLLAIASLAALPAALIGRHSDRILSEHRQAPHSMAARARGVSERRLVLVHGLRNVVIGLAPLLAGIVGYLIGGAMVIEKVFGIRGLGATLADAATVGDGPVVVAAVTLAAAAVACSSVVARELVRTLDPRVSS